ncbi:calcium-binding protein [Rhizobium sp. Root482]|uniref:calcium-binding protein n=1 Tax=Rhizobium sp. Root482 TaxID=1736543 RepID=UPI0007276C4B|nr:calcium-binding protein [Rhizobium sp. Root482]KQY26654.1 hypothetical protein ASD31_00095 [Rhizobium sp. Root482]
MTEGLAFGEDAGTDTISGFEDVVAGGGDDEIAGNDGDNTLVGHGGDDLIDGRAGDDVISGGHGNDQLCGDAGNDRILGGDGNDLIKGGDGDDLLLDGSGEDGVYGGAGDDRLVATSGPENDIYNGGEGWDTLDYACTSTGVTIDLVAQIAFGVEIGDDAIFGFETVEGGAGNDHFVAGGEAMVLVGGDGLNIFEFTADDSAVAPGLVMHEILDFKVGDRVRISKYDLFEQVFDGLEDRFENVYGEGIDEDDIAIRYRNERTDEIDRTVIEADFDQDEIYETTITLLGNHVLVIVEHA